jgi:histidyl-tRNA synthetase
MFKAIRGAKDILPGDAGLWQKIEALARRTFSNYGYREIRTPIIEDSGLFNRCLGALSDIVQKQMFEIKRDREVLCLRPEATASVVRAYIENHLDRSSGFSKFYYIGPMFRAERPQKGRLRQFHHIGIEAIGSLSPYLDVEVISLASRLLDDFGVKGAEIVINSLGCDTDKKKLSAELRAKLKDRLADLCLDCRGRFERNVFRILDCKNPACVNLAKDLKLGSGALCDECRRHFDKVKQGLDALGIKYNLSSRLVRGLDYYTRTVFEIKHPDLGSQDAIAAGGRYDNLVRELGGPDTGAIGFAFGVERIILAASEKPGAGKAAGVYLISLGEESMAAGLKLLDELRKNNIQADTNYSSKSLKGAMREANDSGSRFALIIGTDELEKGVVTLKDMASGEQRQVKTGDLVKELQC